MVWTWAGTFKLLFFPGLEKGLVWHGDGRFVLAGIAKAMSFFRPPGNWCFSGGDRWGCLSYFALPVISHSCFHIVQDGTLKRNSLGLITSQGSLGTYLTRPSRDKRFSSNCSYKTWFLPPGSGFSVFPSMLWCCVWVLGAEEPVTQGNQCSSHNNNNNAIKFSTGIAFFCMSFQLPCWLITHGMN